MIAEVFLCSNLRIDVSCKEGCCSYKNRVSFSWWFYEVLPDQTLKQNGKLFKSENIIFLTDLNSNELANVHSNELPMFLV